MSYTHIMHAAALQIALSHCRGVYQRALVRGSEAWSGATLQGKAKSYGQHYGYSRAGLLGRLHSDPRLAVREIRGDHNRREVTIDLEGLLAARLGGACIAHTDCLDAHDLAVACKRHG